MRPHRLRVTAFGAFAATEQVTFDDLEGLFLLHGETGAGKTTLLDAIAFALYGRVPGERGGARRLRSDHAAPGTATEVELEATIGGRRLRITRKPEQTRMKKSGTGVTTEPASVRLAELSAPGAWESKSTRIGEVDAEIENLMGMSAAQFFQVVLLPQGEFAKFLRADAKDKEALLQKLFGTDRFRKVEDWLADRRRATDKEVAAAEEGVNELVARIAQAAGDSVPDSASRAWQESWAAAAAATAAAERPTWKPPRPRSRGWARSLRRCTSPARKSRPRSAGWRRCAPSPGRPTRKTRQPRPLAPAPPRLPATLTVPGRKRCAARPPVPGLSRHVTTPGRPQERSPPPGKGRTPPAR
jgi:exonuclease SbcC